jgi:uncharacterized protein YqhQ
MMRSPQSFTVAVRRADGRIVVRESRWVSLSDRFKFLKWPLLRGSVVLLESLHNGISALTWSANIAEQGEKMKAAVGGASGPDAGSPAAGGASGPDAGSPAVGGASGPDAGSPAVGGASGPDVPPGLPAPALWATIGLAAVMAIGLFALLPHLLTWLIGLAADSEALQGGQSLAFHLVDGAVKMVILVGYMAAISLLPDVKRLFQYHGAEHRSIHAYENDRELTVENAQGFSRIHERCGTAFLLLVLLVAVLVFSVIFPFVPPPTGSALLNHVIFVGLKIPLLFPIGGVAYEVLRLGGKYPRNPVLRTLIGPGLALQRITTRVPDDGQVEVALISILKTLWRERVGGELPGDERDFASIAEFRASLEEPDVQQAG